MGKSHLKKSSVAPKAVESDTPKVEKVKLNFPYQMYSGGAKIGSALVPKDLKPCLYSAFWSILRKVPSSFIESESLNKIEEIGERSILIGCSEKGASILNSIDGIKATKRGENFEITLSNS